MANLGRAAKNAPRNSLTQFQAFFKDNSNGPATQNRYSILFSPPAVLTSSFTTTDTYNIGSTSNNNFQYLNYYANSVDLPSKQVTTGQITSVGSTYNYATSSTFSQININFLMPRNHKTRMIFERWIQLMSSDSNQYTDYYDDYVCRSLKIYKFERGGGKIIPVDATTKEEQAALKQIKKADRYKYDQLVGIYDIQNIFPINIGSMTLNQQQSGLLEMPVTFRYERYRFNGDGKIDDQGKEYDIRGEFDFGENLTI